MIRDFDGDLRFKLDRSSFMGSTIYWHGYFSYNELHLLDKLLDPWMVFMDVGANQGEFTLFAAKRLPSGKVVAFEPNESTYRHLSENVLLNHLDNVVTYNLGLSDKQGTFDLYTASDADEDLYFHAPTLGVRNEGLATMFPSSHRATKLSVARTEVLDDFFPKCGLDRLDVIKIDVEGAELSLLRGARNVLKHYKPTIIIELNPETCEAAGYSPKDIVTLLEDLDYEFFTIDSYRLWDAWRYGLVGRYGKTMHVASSDLYNLAWQCNVVCRHRG